MSVVSLQPDALRKAVAELSHDVGAGARQIAMQQFLERGFPTRRDEDWKYTDLAEVIDISERWLAGEKHEATEPVDEPRIRDIQATIDAHWLVFSNGHLNLDLSDALSEETISIVRFEDQEAQLDIEDPLADLNAALMVEGVSIRIGTAASIEKPIGLLFTDHTAFAPLAIHARVHIVLEDSSAARFIEYHTSSGDADHYSNVHIVLDIGNEASVNYVRLQNRAREHYQTQRLNIHMGEDSIVRHFGVDLGGAFARNDLKIEIAGAGASAEFNGLYVGGDKQHIDNHTRVDHFVGPATSTQEYRGIMSGQSRCVWNGKAVVHAGADGTDATQANHNLLLSEHSEINAKPELEIYADDVKCSHGTTVGQLDDAALFYLRSRGLDEQHAKRVLTRAFVNSVIANSPIPELQEPISTLVERRLAELGRGEAE